MGVDPGPCPICDTAHCACTTDRGPITVAQLPMRDAVGVAAAPDDTPLGDGSDDRPFSTATYRGKKKKQR